jgi:hypothetical protein
MQCKTQQEHKIRNDIQDCGTASVGSLLVATVGAGLTLSSLVAPKLTAQDYRGDLPIIQQMHGQFSEHGTRLLGLGVVAVGMGLRRRYDMKGDNLFDELRKLEKEEVV